MTFLYKKKYKVYHKILKVLQKHQDEIYSSYGDQQNQPYWEYDISLSIEELINRTGYSKLSILAGVEVLTNREQLTVVMDHPNVFYYISLKGSVAYSDTYYLEAGQKEFLSVTKDYTGIITAIGLFFIALITLIYNINQTRNNTKEIERLKGEIEKSTQK
jgi:hypothetical protein